MALAVLDGNQSATTLSSVVTGGEHIVAHSVVSLGSNAISNITTAISGSTVCVGNLGLLQSTVATEGLSASGSFIKIGGHTGTSTTGNIVHVSAVGALRVDGSVYTQPVSIASVTIGNTVTIAGTVTANPTGTQTIAGTVTANVFGYDKNTDEFKKIPIQDCQEVVGANDDAIPVLPCNEFGNISSSNPLPISGTVTIGSAIPAGTNRIGVVTIGAGTVTIGAGTAQIGSVTVGNTVTIAGTVTANIGLNVAQSLIGGSSETNPPAAVRIGWCGEENFNGVGVDSGGLPLPIQIYLGDSSGNKVTTENPLPISGTVTIGSALPAGTNRIGVVTIGAGTVTIGAGTAQIGSVTASISGTVPVSISSVTVGNSVTIASLPAISGTVTANSSNGSLTTRFGSVTTANTAFATSAVTNSNRKYLLIQNITTASNVITVGVGFTPTTTQGIQLTAGAGLTFEGNYIPTGAVNLLSSVTASCFTILEA